MNRNALLSIIFILVVTGCAAKKEPVNTRPPKKLVAKLEDDVKRKPIKQKPVEVDYKEEGVIVQSIQTTNVVNTQKANQRRFLATAAFATMHDLKTQYENGARVNFRDSDGETVLINVMKGPYDKETFLKLEFLLSVGAAINFRGKSETSSMTTPLDAAVYYSSPVFKNDTESENAYYAEKVIRSLIESGAYLTNVDNMGRSPLHTAAGADNSVAARILLEAGAEITAKDYEGKTPLDYAASDEMKRLLQEHRAQDTKESVPAELEKQE